MWLAFCNNLRLPQCDNPTKLCVDYTRKTFEAILIIRVYNAMGALVGRDVARNVCTITVNGTGVYVVKVGSVAKRVMVN